MMRWAVDIGGIDIESDLQRENTRGVIANKPPPTNPDHEAPPKDAEEKKLEHSAMDETVGEVWTLTQEELAAMQEGKMTAAPAISNPFNNQQGPGATDRLSSTMTSLLQSQSSLNFGGGGLGNDAPATRDLKIFCTFLNPQGKRTCVTVTMNQLQYRGVDIVNAFLMQAIASDDRQSQRYSTNPRLYKLFIADEFTGEEEMAVQLDLKARDFTCYAVNPLPAAKLYLFPQRTELLPTTPYEINLVVNVRSNDPQSEPVRRQCVVPADMLAESLEAVLMRRLPASAIVQGSLRIKYGPLELNINEYYNFGPGCGQINSPIAERTMLSLYRFGVTEVVVSGRAVEVAPDAGLCADVVEDIEIDMDVEEALSFQQFEVICITRYGARQQRVLCVDREHLYTMRPNSESVPNTTERPIKDIEEVRIFPNKPKYMEIAYTKASKYEEDHFECTTTYNCALLDEKLRIVRRELRKREAEITMAPEQKNMMQRIFTGFKSRWFQEKGN